MKFISFDILDEMNVYQTIQKILNKTIIPNDINKQIMEYIFPTRIDPIKVIYEIRDHEIYDAFQIDYNLFVFQLTKAILIKDIYFNHKRLFPHLRNDVLYFTKNILQYTLYKKTIETYFDIFVIIYCEIYIHFYRKTKYECLFYHAYYDINEKCYNLLKNYLYLYINENS
jgi:hypothetical protein